MCEGELMEKRNEMAAHAYALRKNLRRERRGSGSFFISESLIRPKNNITPVIVSIALIIISNCLSLFVVHSQEFRKKALYEEKWVPIMATTAISPFLIVNTPRMMRSFRTSVFCILEWAHCIMACLHHIFKNPIFVVIAGLIFPVWSVWMQLVKEADYDSLKTKGRRRRASLINVPFQEHKRKLDIAAITSVITYIVMWFMFGEIYVLGGAGPMTVLAPFVRHRLYISDVINFMLLGSIFAAENWAHIQGMMYASQILHVAAHLLISYVFYRINVNHFFDRED
mmetsp:Transcript_38661/g.58012  ORF Transcript_38661/g.58012 Transcript_38661/m.58012 type:complete len:283 (-) Transcript_38661:33-881(-)